MSELFWRMSQIDPEAFTRMPGLYRRWEMSQLLEIGWDFHIEEAGKAADGTQLYAVYRRKHFEEETSHE